RDTLDVKTSTSLGIAPCVGHERRGRSTLRPGRGKPSCAERDRYYERGAGPSSLHVTHGIRRARTPRSVDPTQRCAPHADRPEKCPAMRSVVETSITGGTCVACSDRAEPRHLRGSP